MTAELNRRPSLEGPVAISRTVRSWTGPALLIAVCLLPVLLYLPSLGAPLERDEGAYATVAEGILNDKVPYQDLFDNKPPLVYGWYALSFLTFGENAAAPRLFAAALLSLTVVAVFVYCRMVLPRPAAYVAAAFFGLSTGLPLVSLHANTEAFMLLPLVTSLLAFTVGMRRERLLWFVIAGALSGVAIITKQVAVWNLIALAVAGLWWRWSAGSRGWKAFAPSTGVFAGGAAVIAAAGLVFARLGAWDDFVYANISYNYQYVTFLSSAGNAFVLQRSVLSWVLFLALAAPLAIGALVGLLRLVKVRRLSWHYPLVLWTLASTLGVATGGRFYPHYFLELMPALSVLTASAVYDYFAARRERTVGVSTVLATTVLLVTSVITVGLIQLAPYASAKFFSMNAYHQKEWEHQIPALAEGITQRTLPDETIFNYGREAQIYHYSDRLPAAPFFYDWAYTYDVKTLEKTIEVLRRAPPRYIVDTVQPPLFKESDRSPEFDAFLRERYVLVGREYFADVYRLRVEPGIAGREVP
jgi:4-amino-4-deoxy-L-arabinose transferase-like glycosyltransferase